MLAEGQGRNKGGGTIGLQLTPLPPPVAENRNLKNTDFVDAVVLQVLRDLPFSRNQPLTAVG
jgi:hypothetical protein